MNLLSKNSKTLENADDLGYALIQLINENLDVKRWGYYLVYKNFSKISEITLIFSSEFCKISFMFSRQRMPTYDELSIEYGRLHALSEEPFMEWEGGKCRCWHHFLDPLRFLDGLTPRQAMEQVKIQKQLPTVVRDFRESDFGKKLLKEYPPKSALVLQSVLWKHYGQRLFDLFDLRKPDLWQKYQKFLREYYDLLGEKASYGPPYENVC